MSECKYCGKEFKAFNPKTELERWHVNTWMACYEVGTRDEVAHTLKHLYNMKAWHELHIALWAWLAMDGEREKNEWFEMFGVPKVTNYCFACEATETGVGCIDCPIQQFKQNDLCKCANGLYEKWKCTHKIAEREKLAREIATMKWEERI